MAITRLNSLAIPAGTVEPADISYPLTNFSSTGIDDNANALAITIDSSENVGIGTASISSKVSLVASGVQGLHLGQQSDNTGNSGRLFFDNSTNIWTAYSTLGNFKIASGATIGTTSGTDRLVINSSGNVGIGTATATYDLTVVGASNFSTIGTNDAALRLRADGARTMQFYTNSTEAMRINSSGNVGIGDSAPPVKFSVETSTSGNWAAVITNTHATNGFGLKVRAGDNSDVDSFRVADVDNAILYQIDGNGCVKVDPLGNTVGLSSLSIANNAMTIGSTTGFNMAFDSNEIQSRNNGAANNLVFQKNGGNVGIGTASPDKSLHILNTSAGATTTPLLMQNNGGSGTTVELRLAPTPYPNDIGSTARWSAIQAINGGSGNPTELAFLTNGISSDPTERMRIDSSGNLLFSTTTTLTSAQLSAGETGIVARSGDLLIISRDGGAGVLINRKTSDGDLIAFRKDGTTVGSISSIQGTGIRINSQGSDGYLQKAGSDKFVWTATAFSPADDNFRDLGQTNLRYDDIYATNATIQTSDANEKQDIEALSDAETRVAVTAKTLLRKFRWKSAVEEKGDEARIHFGIIAQDLKAAFEAEGLDAGRYAMFIHGTWTDEETGEERSRMGVRYSELVAFIIAAI